MVHVSFQASCKEHSLLKSDQVELDIKENICYKSGIEFHPSESYLLT